jgi:DNA-binding MarR family transcriptional regulator
VTGVTQRDVDVAMNLLAAASRLIEGIQDGLAARGFGDVRPAHGFAFARISAGDATVLDIATHLGVTKQAASQLVEQLVRSGYVRRTSDPADGRRRVLTLTARGRACTVAAEEAAADVVMAWRPLIGAAGLRQLHGLLRGLELTGPLRPAW